MLVYPGGAEVTDTVNMTVRGQAILGRHREYTRLVNITELSSPSMMRFEYHGTTLVGFEFVRVMDGQRVDISAPLEASSDMSESVIVPVLVNSALVAVPVVVLAGAAAWYFRRRRARLNQPRHRAEGHRRGRSQRAGRVEPNFDHAGEPAALGIGWDTERVRRAAGRFHHGQAVGHDQRKILDQSAW